MYGPVMALVIIMNVLNVVVSVNLTGIRIWLRPGKGTRTQAEMRLYMRENGLRNLFLGTTTKTQL